MDCQLPRLGSAILWQGCRGSAIHNGSNRYSCSLTSAHNVESFPPDKTYKAHQHYSRWACHFRRTLDQMARRLHRLYNRRYAPPSHEMSETWRMEKHHGRNHRTHAALKYGHAVPRNAMKALAIDRHVNTTWWWDAINRERYAPNEMSAVKFSVPDNTPG